MKYIPNTPEGTRDRLFGECMERRIVQSQLTRVFRQRGYTEIMTPEMEYYDVFTLAGNNIPQENLTKVIDRSGKICVMRPDMTTPIARVAGTKLKDIHTVRSHPQALHQCRGSIQKKLPGALAQAWWDTAGAAKDLASNHEHGVAAIASRLAAEIYGMEILKEGMEDNPNNFTRFLLASMEPEVPPAGVPLKTSLAFDLDQAGSGALFRALGAFALRDVDLARIESRPIPGSPWRYRFFIDLRAGQDDPRCARALEHLSEMTSELSIIGSYPSCPDWVGEPKAKKHAR